MIIVFNLLAFLLLLATGLPCFLIFGVGLTQYLGRPELVDSVGGIATCLVVALLDFILRLRGDPRRSLHDARLGAHVLFVPLWVAGPFVAATILWGIE